MLSWCQVSCSYSHDCIFTISKLVRNYLEAVEMWFYRRIPWTDKKRNEDVLRETNSQRELVVRIRRRQSAFFGHVMRRGGLEYVVSMGRFEGKRGRGRPRKTMLNSLASWHGGISVSKMIGCTWDRRLWADMITNTTWHGL
ncbi:hypothetical protein BsWGS_22536 [Bradybaena similaris]